MDIFICDKNLDTIRVVDSYTSVIWTERYSSCGDFELEMPYDDELFKLLTLNDGLQDDYCLRIKDSNTVMIIEIVTLITDSENSNTMKLKGRSLESILDRRVIKGQIELRSGIESNIRVMVNKNVISPDDPNREIPGIIFTNSGDARIDSVSVEAQYFNDNLYEKIVEICEAYSVGFRIWPTASGLSFKLYLGQDRSFEQNTNPYVIFSPRFDNLISSNYVESAFESKTTAIIAGEGETAERPVLEKTINGTWTGRKRREMYVDAGNISKTTTDETGEEIELTDQEYIIDLLNKGMEELSNYQYEKSFEGEIDSSLQFKYGTDYFIGDLVEVENEYGISMKARVSELIRSYDSNGYKEYPTFTKVV